MEADVEEPLPISDAKEVARAPWVSKHTSVSQAEEWITYFSQQALIYKETIREVVDPAISYARTRLSEILSTASAHSQLTFETMKEVASDLNVYEDVVVGKVKVGVHEVSSHPFIYGAVVTGLGAVIFKRPRRFLYYRTLPIFVSEEAMILRVDAEVKELRHSFNILKAEREKLEKKAVAAEEEFIRGRTKLRQAGKQIQSAIQSAYKIRRQAAGLRDILRELPSREGSKFRKQVNSLASEIKQEKNSLAKEVNKINNYGISV